MTVTCTKCGCARRNPAEQVTRGRPIPYPGDFWICWTCGALHRFTHIVVDVVRGRILELHVRPADMAELDNLDPQLRASLLAARRRIVKGAGVA